MPNFLENIFARLIDFPDRVILREIHGQRFVSVTAKELLEQVARTRAYLRRNGLQPGDRCAIVAPNSIRWTALDLALMAEGVIVVPLYFRQAPSEIVAMIRDCQPRLILVGDSTLSDSLTNAWSGGVGAAPRCILFEEIFADNDNPAALAERPNPRSDDEIVTIIYTSGTSGEAKGVCLTVGNVSYMLLRTTDRLNQLMGRTHEPDRIFHYLPLNFAASWIALLSFLSRDSVVTLSTDFTKLADEIRLTAPHYFLNVPTLLERVRRGVEEALSNRPAIIRRLFAKSSAAWKRSLGGQRGTGDRLWLALGRKLIFSKIRERFGPHLRALICGSAPLAPETQQFFLMLGIPALQVYGLTETTGICTMDDPRIPTEPGFVGNAIPGMEMTIAENEEIVVRGPHIFAGYWNRPEETARVLRDGWFHTGDQGEVNARGNWRISGRIKNLIILNSGHNIAPEPIEERLRHLLPSADQIILVGNGRSYLCLLVTGNVERSAVQSAVDTLNSELPHYRQIRNFSILPKSFAPESGMLTAMGKLRREIVNARFANEINAMYDVARSPQQASRRSA